MRSSRPLPPWSLNRCLRHAGLRTARRAALVVIGVLTMSCAPPDAGRRAARSGVPGSIILLLADGAGPAHWTLATFADDDLAVRRMKTVGLVDTRGADHVVSGSAPTATALATGVRSFMGAVGVGPDSLPVENVAEVAMARGMSAGVVTTTRITDATPAAFSAHEPSRSAMGDIARQQAESGLDVLMGGGRALFYPAAQSDGFDLLAAAKERYTYVESIGALRSLDTDSVTSLLGLFADGEMGPVSERGPDALTAMATSALAVLGRNPRGFFLMVENEESDSRSHANDDAETITAEMLDFDRLVGVALAYQAEHPETLVLVTGDHETGGMTLTYGDDDEREAIMTWATGSHTGTLLPLFASGPGAERFGGIIRNDDVGRILMELVRAR